MHFCLSSLMHRQWKRVLLPYRELKWQSRLQEANWRIILIDLMPTPSSSEKENDKSLKDSSECSLTTITVFVKSYRSFHLPFEPRFFRFKLFREWLNQNRWKLGNSTGWERTWPIPRSQWEIKQSTRFGGISFEFWWFTIGNSNQFRMKLWKGLFYTFWMSDKPPVQEALATLLSDIVDIDLSIHSRFLTSEWTLYPGCTFPASGRRWSVSGVG